MPHLDDIPLTLVGKGEQNAVKVKLAMEASVSITPLCSTDDMAPV